MGTFGYRNFENDSGLDFEDDFIEAPTPATIRLALLPIVRTVAEGGFIEYHEACMALAAAEVIAVAVGKPSSDFPDELLPLIESLVLKYDISTRTLARKAVKQVLKKSEVQELWAENGEPNEWQAAQRDLLLRLK